MLLLSVLFLLLNAVEYSSGERFNIVPSPDSPCPGEFTGEPCLTLQQYVANPGLGSITLELNPGNHSLDSQLSVLSVDSFVMRANISATVTCSQQGFYFYQLQLVHVTGITFVGCRMNLQYVINATFERNLFVNRTRCCDSGAAIYAYYSASILVRLCVVSNNNVFNGAIYGYQSNFIIEQTTFINNYYQRCCSITNGGAIYTAGSGSLDILSSNFINNSASAYSGHGGAIYFDGSNITVTNSTFISNTASAGGGGAIYSAGHYTIVSLVNNTFSQNKAAYCGVLDINEFYHRNVNITGNTFMYNRATGLTSGNNGGGVICIRNASMTISGNNFSHNSAIGDAGVIRVDESDVVIEKSIFNNNTGGGNGGVFHTYFYPNQYTISHSTFTNNRAGDDGGVMYVGRAGSRVNISQSTFSHNHAHERGGVVAILGSTLQIDGINSLQITLPNLEK